MLAKALIAASLKPVMLSLLAEGDLYGYDLTRRIRAVSDGKIRWASSKLYPVLHDLENRGLVSSYWEPSDAGPDRKYYHLTPKGRSALEAAKQEWLDLNRMLVRLWGPDLTLQPGA